MAGAIAGTAILKANKLTNKLDTITLTINNQCNMSCPHCYLQYKSNTNLINQNTINSVFKSDFKHIAIVGQEPLYDKVSIDILSNIVISAKESNKTVSIVTNGLNLLKLPQEIIKLIDFIDISFDGGPVTYKNFRNSDFHKLIKGVDYLMANGIKEMNALHTINNRTIDFIDDCININKYAHFDNVMFSPYLITENFGSNNVESVNLLHLIDYLINNELFLKTDEAFLLIDNYHIEQDQILPSFLENIIREKNIERKIKLFKNDPIFHGIIRVTYNDIVLSPKESLHTKRYDDSNFCASNSNINLIFQKIKEEFEYAV
jgi:sulfatase maturation enzyme AslB (radical SAM superfamily)